METLLTHLLGFKLSGAIFDMLAEMVEATEDEKAYLKYALKGTLGNYQSGIEFAAKREGLTIPESVSIKDHFERGELIKIADNMIAAVLSQRDNVPKFMLDLDDISAKAFGGHNPYLKHQLALLKKLYEVAESVTGEDIADVLLERHLKLVH